MEAPLEECSTPVADDTLLAKMESVVPMARILSGASAASMVLAIWNEY
jgi:hypothetical protein